MKDMVVHNETGYLVPTWIMPCQSHISGLSPASNVETEYLLMGQTVWVDTEAMAEALRSLLGSPERRAAMGSAGRARAAARYAWTRLRQSWHTVWDALLAEAARETSEQARRRREHAGRLGLPTPYLYLFGHYGTGVFRADAQAFRITERGRAVAVGEESLAFYDDTLALLHPEIFDALLAVLGAADRDGAVLDEMVRHVADRTGRDGDTIRFHVALLLKRGAILPCPSPATTDETA
jgi:hypothetical protein